MFRRRVTIASLLAVVLFLALVFAGLRTGTTMWMRSIYTVTFLTLVYAAIAARYRGAFWYGFSVAGWTYLVMGITPWSDPSSLGLPHEGVNGSLFASWFYLLVIDILSNWHVERPGQLPHLFLQNRAFLQTIAGNPPDGNHARAKIVVIPPDMAAKEPMEAMEELLQP